MAFSGGRSSTGGSLAPYRPSAAVRGTGGADALSGTAGSETLGGLGGDDTLCGRAGDDWLDGGAGRDLLIGGAGDDVFVFAAVRHSAGGSSDAILGGDGAPAFEGAGRAGGDRIDLSGIDADTTRTGEQAFEFGSGTGRLVVVERGGHSVVQASTDADAAFEFVLVIEDGAVPASAYTAADFIL
jgi:Ca2+-binding RTX toxin-like protein